jgi:CRISPR-associated protein (TIGR02584 family)
MKNILIASLGTSPGVLSETAWQLCVTERLHIHEIEVWTTTDGRDRVLQELNDGLWDRLRAAMPADEDRARLQVNLTAAQIKVFQGADGEPLPDIRTADDSQQLLQQLCERVRELTAGGGVTLFGSMAGGRKTMSAALQTAFELYAGRHDRLLHVLLHHRLEGDREIVRDFRFPEPRWEDKGGVPMDQQISITEVPFPRLRPQLKILNLELRDLPYQELIDRCNDWSVMQEPCVASWLTATPQHNDSDFLLTIQWDGLTREVALSEERLFVLRQIKQGVTNAKDLADHYAEEFPREVNLKDSADDRRKKRDDAFKKCLQRLNDSFQGLPHRFQVKSCNGERSWEAAEELDLTPPTHAEGA